MGVGLLRLGAIAFKRALGCAVAQGALVLSGETLYGTTFEGGSWGKGTVFALSTNGTNFTTLYSFTPLVSGTNRDGAWPYTGLILSGNTLYGTAKEGGAYEWGTVFALNTNGMGFTTLYSFTGGDDRAFPYASLILTCIPHGLRQPMDHRGSRAGGAAVSFIFA